MFLLPLIIRFILGFLLIKLVGAEVTLTTAETTILSNNGTTEEQKLIQCTLDESKLNLMNIFNDTSKHHFIHLLIRHHKNANTLNKLLNVDLENGFIFKGITFFQKIIMDGPSTALIELMKDEYQIDFNEHFTYGCFYSADLIKKAAANCDLQNLTPLMLAIVSGNKRSVELLVGTKLKTPLDFYKRYRPCEGSSSCSTAARDIARKIKDRSKRHAMLNLLKLDTEIHANTGINTILKGDMKVSVKEAVYINDYEVINAALNLGNYGNKQDEVVMRLAFLHLPSYIIEVLILEGYMLPSEGFLNDQQKLSTESLKRLKGGHHPDLIPSQFFF